MRLIDTDEIKSVPIFNGKYDRKNANPDFIAGIETVMEHIEQMQTIDPIHAAGGCYCKECELHNNCSVEYVFVLNGLPDKNKFCSVGEKVKNEMD